MSETDENLIASVGHEQIDAGIVAADFARRLESERDEAREAAAKWEPSFDAMERAGAEQARRADENREWALRAERERDEARERAKELSELVDGSYIFVELHKPDCEYNKKWREAWMEKAKRLIPGVDSIWY